MIAVESKHQEEAHEMSQENVKLKGTVKWFSDEKGYGFIAPEGSSKDVFAHFSGILGTGRRSLQDGQNVEFEIEQTDRGPKAVNIQVVAQ